jgi:hypothetical protein
MVNRKKTPAIPDAILQLQRQLDQFRSTQPRRTKLPDSLWQAAVGLARQHGVYSVAHPLRLDYMALKRRLSGVPVHGRKATKPEFVELITPPEECVIEFEAPSGNKMRVRWTASAPRDWLNLLRAWREAEG